MSANRRPIFGMGPTGWVGLLIVVLVVGNAALGNDLFSQVITLIGDVWGVAGIDYYMAWWHIPAGLLVQAPGFTVISAIPAAIALHVAPIRTRPAAWIAMFLWALLHSSGYWFWLVKIPVIEAVLGFSVSRGVDERVLALVDVVLEIPTIVILFWTTGDKRLALRVAGLIVLVFGVHVYLASAAPATSIFQPGSPLALSVAWNVLFAATLLEWAIRRRIESRREPPNPCPTCGFDLRASASRCPECGASVAAA